MALLVDQQPTFKHFCKICKKGFICGRALGGHMRAHGIGDENCNMEEDDPASDWEDKLGANVPPGTRRMYALRTNPNRLKSCRVCENCGKEFLSWKSFLEHGKCTSEDADQLLVSSSPESDDIIEDGTPRRGCGWSKRKRSLRAKVGNFNLSCPSSEEEDLANCLMMLSNATVDPLEAEPEESCASASKEEERRNPMSFMAHVEYKPPVLDKAKGIAKGMFECKACKKVFNSHQALGGHRASHKKVKGCYAARLDQSMEDSLVDHDEDAITHEEFFPTKTTSTLQFDHGSTPPLASTSKRKSKVHECSICHRVFSSGQALGGHKRCHWITSNSPDTSSLPSKFHQFQDHLDQIQQGPKFINNSEPLDLTLDLNLPVHPSRANPSKIDISTEIYLQPWTRVDAKVKDDNNECHQQQNEDDHHDNKDNNNNDNDYYSSVQNVDDEADSKVKLAKLSELKDMSTRGSSSPWLQVGIGSTTDVAADHL